MRGGGQNFPLAFRTYFKIMAYFPQVMPYFPITKNIHNHSTKPFIPNIFKLVHLGSMHGTSYVLQVSKKQGLQAPPILLYLPSSFLYTYISTILSTSYPYILPHSHCPSQFNLIYHIIHHMYYKSPKTRPTGASFYNITFSKAPQTHNNRLLQTLKTLRYTKLRKLHTLGHFMPQHR